MKTISFMELLNKIEKKSFVIDHNRSAAYLKGQVQLAYDLGMINGGELEHLEDFIFEKRDLIVEKKEALGIKGG